MIHGRPDAQVSGLIFDNVTIAGELIDNPDDFCTNTYVQNLQFCDSNNANCMVPNSNASPVSCPCDLDSGYSWLNYCPAPAPIPALPPMATGLLIALLLTFGLAALTLLPYRA